MHQPKHSNGRRGSCDSRSIGAYYGAATIVPFSSNIVTTPVKLIDLPAGRINHHWTKNVIASPDGSKLYAAVGSNSNAGENGILHEQGRAAIWEIDRATGSHRVFASGLRNPVGLAWEPETRKLWVAVNERDELGADLLKMKAETDR